MKTDLTPNDYLNKRCFIEPFFGNRWLFTRYISSIRCIIDKDHYEYWEVRVWNWFWYEWFPLDRVRLIYEQYP